MKNQALLIGINQYQNLTELKYARQDAEEVAKALKQNYCFSDDEIILLTDAKRGVFFPSTKGVIQKHLEDITQQDCEFDLFIFGFWGHGLYRSGQRYLCPQAVMDEDVCESGLSFDALKEQISNVKAKNTCMIFDCCQTIEGRSSSETLSEADLTIMDNAVRDIVQKRKEQIPEIQSNVAIINSCSKGQRAYEWDNRKHGIFTAHLLDALNYRYFTVSSLVSYVEKRVKQTAQYFGKVQKPYCTFKGDIDYPLPALSPRMGDVFISYRSHHIELVEPILKEFRKRGIQYYIDREKLKSGNYARKITDAIKACKVLLLFWTEDVNGSQNVITELDLAQEWKKEIIPYKIGDFDINDQSDVIYYLKTKHMIVNPRDAINDVVDSVEQALAELEKKHDLSVPGIKAGERKTVTVNDVEFAFRWCPPGTFIMGSPKSEDGRDDNEKQHRVTLTNGFWMLETQVTKKQWKAVMGNNTSNVEGDDLPVDNVSWNDCQEFCKKCSLLGMPVQLPTESQWEYACRAETTGAYAGNLDKMAWYYDNSKRETHPVGKKESNAWGLYDMHGNVWEWCQDRFDDYENISVIDPVCSSDVSNCVVRGGSWDSCASYCRSAYRGRCETDYRDEYLGFRCARTIISQEN